MPFSLICIAANGWISFFLVTEQYSTYHIFIHSSIDGHSGFYHLSSIWNSNFRGGEFPFVSSSSACVGENNWRQLGAQSWCQDATYTFSLFTSKKRKNHGRAPSEFTGPCFFSIERNTTMKKRDRKTRVWQSPCCPTKRARIGGNSPGKSAACLDSHLSF